MTEIQELSAKLYALLDDENICDACSGAPCCNSGCCEIGCYLDEAAGRVSNREVIVGRVIKLVRELDEMRDALETAQSKARLREVEVGEMFIDQRAEIHELKESVSSSGVELDDERLGYVVVQIDRAVWDSLKEGGGR